MFLVDRLLMAPLRGLMWIFREVQEAVDEDKKQQRSRLMQSLAMLHRQFERGEIDEASFAAAEWQLLEQLDTLQRKPPSTESP